MPYRANTSTSFVSAYLISIVNQESPRMLREDSFICELLTHVEAVATRATSTVVATAVVTSGVLTASVLAAGL